jgi:adenine deaminase
MARGSRSIKFSQELIAVALGEAPADLAIIGGDLVNIYSGEVHRGEVLVKDDTIAYVGESAAHGIGNETQVINAEGKVLIPGLIDGHTHVDNNVFSELAPYALRGATTTIIAETTGLPFPTGYRGLVELLDSARDQPLRIYATITPMATANPKAAEHGLTVNQVSTLLARPEVLGLGESYWNPVFGSDQRVMTLIETARRMGKRVEGHSAGAKNNRLQAYVSAGITSCHEPINPAEVLERLRLGLFVFLREGETRQDLDVLAGIKDMAIDFSNLGLATDGVGPRHLVSKGYMDNLVQRAIDLGFAPVTAFQMASHNVARYFGIDHIVGGIAPGRAADIVVIPDLTRVRAETVVCRGKIVVADGKFVAKPRRHRFPSFMTHSLKLPKRFCADDFTVPVEHNADKVKVKTIDLRATAIKQEVVLEVPVKGNQIQIDIERDILKITAIERTHNPGQAFTGFIRGLGLKNGAIATSDAADSWVILVVGADEADMALAVNRVCEMQGGTVVVAGKRVLAEIALSIGGIITDSPLAETAHTLDAVQQAYQSLGGILPEIRVPLTFLTSEAIPFFAICEQGLIDMKRQQINRSVLV